MMERIKSSRFKTGTLGGVHQAWKNGNCVSQVVGNGGFSVKINMDSLECMKYEFKSIHVPLTCFWVMKSWILKIEWSLIFSKTMTRSLWLIKPTFSAWFNANFNQSSLLESAEGTCKRLIFVQHTSKLVVDILKYKITYITETTQNRIDSPHCKTLPSLHQNKCLNKKFVWNWMLNRSIPVSLWRNWNSLLVWIKLI